MTTDFLARIVATKRAALEAAKKTIPYETISQEATSIRQSSRPHALTKVLRNNQINVIAEFKRRSPSKGVIRDNVSPQTMARFYGSGGAAAISVLTEEHFFDGSLDDLRAVRAAVSLPVLRKDFIVDDYQVYESAAAGADALLLIVALLSDDSLNRLRRLTEEELGMDALVEVHTKTEMERATASGAKFVGVNNRDLKTFAVSVDTSVELLSQRPADGILISESGFNSGADLRRLHALGYNGFLIGESLMSAERPDKMLRELIGAN
ncbi:MAG: indole-3-glycerol phosphate synthase TrpC [Pyrinomonadaceae bacterium]